ncbi:vegetative cell wall protein gp1-like [Helianthus annuus]|uniref:vegetative cell wall protein gp1-like n=1 Tax=Helianthus annuus TaxID=4232 RepID=UPI000B8F2469|nr:vegetative cell wall protein gp1-like [Helianthus annuus]
MVLHSPIRTLKSTKNLGNPDKPVANPLPQSQFSPTPTQPSSNTVSPSEPVPQSIQSTTQIPPIPPPPFPNIDNMPPVPNKSSSSQQPPFTQPATTQYSLPYVRIVHDENHIPLNQSLPINSSTTSLIPNQHPHYQSSQPQPFSFKTLMFDQRDDSGEYGDGFEEFESYVGESRQ